MTTTTSASIQHIANADFSQAYNSVDLIESLQLELTALRAKVTSYYHEEIVLRGDKILMREYCGYFEIEPKK